MTTWHTMYCDLVSFLTGYKSGEMADDVPIGELRQNIKEFKSLLEATLDEHYGPRLYTLKFHCWIM